MRATQHPSQAHAEGRKHESLTAEQKEERKQRILTHGTPSVVGSISDALVIKSDNIFFLSKPDGDVPSGGSHGYGLYYHDCRYLNSYVLKIAGADANPLVSDAGRDFTSVFQLTNPDIRMHDGTLIEKEHIGIEWSRVVDGGSLTLHDVLTFQNFGLKEIEFPITLHFEAEFEDVFAVRGLFAEHNGQARPPRWVDGALYLVYDGADGRYRSTTVSFSEQPATKDDCTAEFKIHLKPRDSHRLSVTVTLRESENENDVQPQKHKKADAQKTSRGKLDDWLKGQTQVTSDSLLVNSIIERSLRDLLMLTSHLRNEAYIAAGLPWFATLFGRDSATTALQTLAYQPQTAEQTLRLLAQYQGDHVEDWRDEQPGKILHSTRVGEMARLGEIPHSPYYGTVDATPLFLILLCEHTRWTGDLGLFNDLRDNVDRALEWMDKYGDFNNDGYIEYASTSEKGLINQGWKDSGDAMVNADGSLATPPIALAEVQGYAYMARLGIAGLYRKAGDGKRADELQKQAESLRACFNMDFWLGDKGFYAMALQKEHKPAAVLSSNPGQAMWTGIVDDDKAKLTVQRLMGSDMFSGWGVRTLSSNETRFNPVSYHLGTVWPHDNSIIAAGFRRYGYDSEAARICNGIIQAAMNFPHYRLPELFAGFGRDEYGVPVHYPVACHPQAWAAGSVPFMIQTMLGLQPEAFDNRLRIVRPTLPDYVNRVEVKGLRVGKGSADIRFDRDANGCIEVNVEKADGGLEVRLETDHAPTESEGIQS